MDINEKLPENLEWYRDQIAGHHPSVVRNGLRQIGIIKERGSKLILKLAQEGARGDREVALYEKVEGSTVEGDRLMIELRHFLPRYYGRRSLKLGVRENDFIELEDITNPFKKPCIMDIKIGQVTYDPTASEEKKKAESSKAPFQEVLGFRLLGYRIHSDSTETISRDRLWGRELTEENVQQAFEEFLLAVRPEAGLNIVENFINRLERISNWFNEQERLHFYASSLLFVYEGHSKYEPVVDIRMIDFSHVFLVDSDESSLDVNYIFGLNYICKTFLQIRNDLLKKKQLQ